MLTELAAAPATNDEFYVRDVSECACCESKRITWSNIFLNADLPGTLDVTGATTLDSTLTVVDKLSITTGGLCVIGNAVFKNSLTITCSSLFADQGATIIRGCGLTPLNVRNNADTDSQIAISIWGNNRACPTDNDEAYLSLNLENCSALPFEFVRLTWKALDVGPSCSYDSRPEFQYYTAGTLRELVFPAITADDTVAVLGLAQTYTAVPVFCCGISVAGAIITPSGNLTINPTGNIQIGALMDFAGNNIRDVGTLRGRDAAAFTIAGNELNTAATAQRVVMNTIDTACNALVNVAMAVPTGTETTPFWAQRGDVTTPLVGTLDASFLTFKWNPCDDSVTVYVNDGGTIRSVSIGTVV